MLDASEPTDYDRHLVDFKLAVIRELTAALEAEGSDKVVMIEMEGLDPEFFTLRFSLSGDALLRLDDLMRSHGMEPKSRA
jgi:hypothetical protein